MSEEKLNLNGFWRNLSQEDIICGLVHAEENKAEREKKGLLPPVVFLTKKIEEIQGGPDERAKELRRYGSKKEPTMPYGFDEDDEGLRKAECMLAFLDETLTRSPEKRDERMAEEARSGAGYICRVVSELIGHYRTNLCNSIDHLQKLMNEQAKPQEEAQEGGKGHE
jgi:hypothetical protein